MPVQTAVLKQADVSILLPVHSVSEALPVKTRLVSAIAKACFAVKHLNCATLISAWSNQQTLLASPGRSFDQSIEVFDAGQG